MAVLSARPNLAKRSKTTHAWSLKGARQSAFTVLEFFNREPFFGLRQFLGDKFSFPLAGVAFPMQRGIEPTNVEARHLCPARLRRRNDPIIYVQTMQVQASKNANLAPARRVVRIAIQIFLGN